MDKDTAPSKGHALRLLSLQWGIYAAKAYSTGEMLYSPFIVLALFKVSASDYMIINLTDSLSKPCYPIILKNK